MIGTSQRLLYHCQDYFRLILLFSELNQAGDSGLIRRDFKLPAPTEIWSNLTDRTLARRNSLEKFIISSLFYCLDECILLETDVPWCCSDESQASKIFRELTTEIMSGDV